MHVSNKLWYGNENISGVVPLLAARRQALPCERFHWMFLWCYSLHFFGGDIKIIGMVCTLIPACFCCLFLFFNPWTPPGRRMNRIWSKMFFGRGRGRSAQTGSLFLADCNHRTPWWAAMLFHMQNTPIGLVKPAKKYTHAKVFSSRPDSHTLKMATFVRSLNLNLINAGTSVQIAASDLWPLLVIEPSVTEQRLEGAFLTLLSLPCVFLIWIIITFSWWPGRARRGQLCTDALST